MSTTAADAVGTEVQRMLRAAAEPWRAGDSVKAGLRRAGAALGLSPSRARVGWYGRAAAWRAAEVDALRQRYQAVLQQRHDRLQREAEALRLLLEAARRERSA